MARPVTRLAAKVVAFGDGMPGLGVDAHGSTLPEFLRAAERAALEGALRLTGGHNTHAAEFLGVGRRHFQQRLVVHELGALARELRDGARVARASTRTPGARKAS